MFVSLSRSERVLNGKGVSVIIVVGYRYSSWEMSFLLFRQVEMIWLQVSVHCTQLLIKLPCERNVKEIIKFYHIIWIKHLRNFNPNHFRLCFVFVCLLYDLKAPKYDKYFHLLSLTSHSHHISIISRVKKLSWKLIILKLGVTFCVKQTNK